MTNINGRHDGRQVVLDEPVPGSNQADTPVRIVHDGADAQGVLDKIARLARPGGEPPYFSHQLEYYVRGGSRR